VPLPPATPSPLSARRRPAAHLQRRQGVVGQRLERALRLGQLDARLGSHLACGSGAGSGAVRRPQPGGGSSCPRCSVDSLQPACSPPAVALKPSAGMALSTLSLTSGSSVLLCSPSSCLRASTGLGAPCPARSSSSSGSPPQPLRAAAAAGDRRVLGGGAPAGRRTMLCHRLAGARLAARLRGCCRRVPLASCCISWIFYVVGIGVGARGGPFSRNGRTAELALADRGRAELIKLATGCRAELGAWRGSRPRVRACGRCSLAGTMMYLLRPRVDAKGESAARSSRSWSFIHPHMQQQQAKSNPTSSSNIQPPWCPSNPPPTSALTAAR
jgi:hypothetical protein